MPNLVLLHTPKCTFFSPYGLTIEEEEEEEEEEETLLIYTAQGSPFRRKKLSVINGIPEQNATTSQLFPLFSSTTTTTTTNFSIALVVGT